MRPTRPLLALLPLLMAAAFQPATASTPPSVVAVPLSDAIERVVRQASFEDIALSPNGDYFAASVPQGEKTILVVMRRADKQITSVFRMEGKTHVAEFEWVNPTRILLSIGQRFDQRERPLPTGEVYALDAEGDAEILAGPRARTQQTGTMIRQRDDGSSFVFLMDGLRNDDQHALVSAYATEATAEPMTRAERMDVETGKRRVVARAPVRRASFLADPDGQVRFATGLDIENHTITYYRAADGAEWQLLNSEKDSGRVVQPVGFSADGRTAFLRTTQPSGPDALESMDVGSGERRSLLRDPVADPDEILRDLRTGEPIGVRFVDGVPRSVWFDPEHPAARSLRSLEAAFPGHRVTLRSVTDDGRLQLVFVSSDRNPGDYYLFDTVGKQAELVLSAAEWIDPEQMAAETPITLKARDGVELRGFLTVPRGAEAKNLPLVVHPHGGPFGIQDTWGYEGEVQLLASQGYAVLQVNFRGSGGFGDAFNDAGARQWGRLMQDDLTDATRWAVAQGIADPTRICLYGSSYGGYAALMGAVREPTLYRCVAGNIGVYDLALMFRTGDIGETRSGENFLEEFVGTTGLEAISPTKQAAAIKVPVFLAAGDRDERAPKEHTEMMARALVEAGNPPEMVIYPNEGHGYYAPENRRDYYGRLLGFLAKYLAPAP